MVVVFDLMLILLDSIEHSFCRLGWGNIYKHLFYISFLMQQFRLLECLCWCKLMKIQFCDSDIIQLISLSEVVVGLQVKYVERSEGSCVPLLYLWSWHFRLLYIWRNAMHSAWLRIFGVCISFVFVVTWLLFL